MILLQSLILFSSFLTALASPAKGKIDREKIVRRFNPQRNASSTGTNATPLQVGNGNFAFGADITGMQTFYPFNSLSSWCWHNSSLPKTPNQTDPSDFTGLDWWTHGRLVNYDQPNPQEDDISQWLIRNPQRVNLGRVGFSFGSDDVTEDDLNEKKQYLDLYSGVMYSKFVLNGKEVSVQTIVDPESSTVAFEIDSEALGSGDLGIFFDYPIMTPTNKFEAPFVGNYSSPQNHTTSIKSERSSAVITHTEDSLTYYTLIDWGGEASMQNANSSSHRYYLNPKKSKSLSVTVTYSPTESVKRSECDSIKRSSASWWRDYWEKGNFIDMTASGNASAIELQRRVVLSQYLLAVNSAGEWFPQESGLTDNGWCVRQGFEIVQN